jgi:hypothetical protein
MAQALKEKLEDFLAGKINDGRSIAALRRKGVLNAENGLTEHGARLLGVFLNCPEFKITNPATYAGKAVLISETHNYDYDTDCDEYLSSYTNIYLISAEKLMQEYAVFAVLANEYIKKQWSYEHDQARNWAAKTYASWLKEHAKTKPEFRPNDRSYIWHILECGMTAIVDGIPKTQTSTSNKYSISDTENEIQDMLVTEGEIICRIDVEVAH